MTTIAVTNPATGEVVQMYAAHDAAAVDERIARAAAAFAVLRSTTFEQRAAWARAAADLLDRDRDAIATDMVLEMGKTLEAARAEVAKCAAGFRFYAEHAESFLADEPLAKPADVGAASAFTRWQPMGPVLAVMPWNFPLWQTVRFAAPALMAGNVGLLKHASNVPRSALRLESVLAEAGFPEGSFQTLLVGSAVVETVLRDPRVVAVTLTGSEAAGRAVAAIASDEVKPSVLELGGSDPFVVLGTLSVDALARSAAVAVTARCQNNGQSCIAAKRFIVHSDVWDPWLAAFAQGMAALRVGDPLDPATDMGPLVSEQGRRDVHELVEDARKHGATVVCGGVVPDGPGWFYPPTVLTDVTPAMRVFREEVFGPVAVVLRAADDDEALRLANDSPFGLGSSVWTDDDAQADRFAEELEAGAVFVNGMVTSYPQLAFGGIKRSGYGRELAALGIRAFCNAKTVWVAAPVDPADPGEPPR